MHQNKSLYVLIHLEHSSLEILEIFLNKFLCYIYYEKGIKTFHYVEGNAKYFKITTIDDLEMARLIVKGYEKN